MNTCTVFSEFGLIVDSIPEELTFEVPCFTALLYSTTNLIVRNTGNAHIQLKLVQFACSSYFQNQAFVLGVTVCMW